MKLIITQDLIEKRLLQKKSVRVSYLLLVVMVSSWLTPPDPISMLMVAVPVYGCYEIGLLISPNNERFVECSWDEIMCS